MDEGIGRDRPHPLSEIPGLLRQDESPPLLLPGPPWVDGTLRDLGDGHACLSLLCSLVSIPVALWAGWSLFWPQGELVICRAGRLQPLPVSFATETKMYALVFLLALLAGSGYSVDIIPSAPVATRKARTRRDWLALPDQTSRLLHLTAERTQRGLVASQS